MARRRVVAVVVVAAVTVAAGGALLRRGGHAPPPPCVVGAAMGGVAGRLAAAAVALDPRSWRTAQRCLAEALAAADGGAPLVVPTRDGPAGVGVGAGGTVGVETGASVRLGVVADARGATADTLANAARVRGELVRAHADAVLVLELVVAAGPLEGAPAPLRGGGVGLGGAVIVEVDARRAQLWKIIIQR